MDGLKGIARLAAAGGLIEAKRRVDYREIETRRIIGRCSSARMPFEWTVNPYRGCEFGCKYCYARYAHEFMELRRPEDFETRIFVKSFSKAQFAAELKRIPRDEWIAIGTATDPYQPAERRFNITRQILEVFAEGAGRSLSVTTKSDLVARDAELLANIGRRNILHVHMTVTTTDAALARLVEPFAPRPDLRLAAVAELASRGVRTGVFANPIMPLINDSADSIEAVARDSKASGAIYFSGRTVFLKPCAQAAFYPFLEQHFPHLLRKYKERFSENAYLQGEYPATIAARVREARERHGLTDQLSDYEPELWEGEQQLELFPIIQKV